MSGELSEQVSRAVGDAKTRMVRLEETVYRGLEPKYAELRADFDKKTKGLEADLEAAERNAAGYKGELDELKTKYTSDMARVAGELDSQKRVNNELEAGLAAVRKALANGAEKWFGTSPVPVEGSEEKK